MQGGVPTCCLDNHVTNFPRIKREVSSSVFVFHQISYGLLEHSIMMISGCGYNPAMRKVFAFQLNLEQISGSHFIDLSPTTFIKYSSSFLGSSVVWLAR